MPTPLGHTLAGLAVHLATGERFDRRGLLQAAGLVALASAPDLDFVPGYLVGEPRAYHWGPAHSLGAALLAGLGAGLVARALKGRFWRFFLLGTAAYASHLCLDMLLGPGARSEGLQVLWPLTTERFTAPWHVFLMLPGRADALDPLRALFSPVVLPLLVRELAVLGPVCLGAWLLSRRAGGAPARLERRGAFRVADEAGEEC